MGVAGGGEPPERRDRDGSAAKATAPPAPERRGPAGDRAATGPADGRARRAAPAQQAAPSVPHQPERRAADGDGQEPDSALLRRMRGGDDAAYETLYQRHVGAVRRYAHTCCRDAHTAEDLTHEVFTRTLQAVRAGAGPDTAVRAYLLTSVRRVAAAWVRTAKREQLVEDFAVFAQSAGHASRDVGGAAGDADTLSLGADVRAMQDADRTMAVQAFRSLPEKYQTVLWHTAVEEESPKDVAPLLGLSDNATAVLAHRAREKLKQAYLQAHVARAGAAGGDCARYAYRLGAYARGGLRKRAAQGLRKHLRACAACRTAATEVVDLNAHIRLLLPVAFLGWLGAAGGAKGGLWGAGGGAAGVAAATAGKGGAAAHGLGAPVKIGVAAGVAATAAVAVALALAGEDRPATVPQAGPSAAPLSSSPPPASSPEPRPERPVEPVGTPGPPSPGPGSSSAPERRPEPERPSPKSTPPPSSTPTPTSPPTPPPAAPQEVFQLNRLSRDVPPPGADRDEPTVRTGTGGWVWQRYGLRVGRGTVAHGVTVRPPSSVTVDLNRPCTAYDALAAVDRLTLGDRPVRFAVYGDGSRLWRSPAVRRGDEPVPVHVPLTGVHTVRLVVESVPAPGLGDRLTLADWAQSRISCR